MEVKFKKITEDKLEKIMNWRMMPEVTKYMYTDPKLNLIEQKKWFYDIQHDPTVKYWIVEVDGLDIGVINLSNIDLKNLNCSWGYYIADLNFRGKGLAKIIECNIYDYVFYELCLNKIWCEVLSFNKKVVELHEKYGSEVEGVFKQHILKNGRFYDVIRMAITKEKWDRIRANFDYQYIEIE